MMFIEKLRDLTLFRVRYAALVDDSRSIDSDQTLPGCVPTDSASEECRFLCKEERDSEDQQGHNALSSGSVPHKRRCSLNSWPMILFYMALVACSTLLGYAAIVVSDHVGLDPGSESKAQTSFGNEYNKFIYKENKYGEWICPDEDLTLRREWRELSHVEKRQFIQAVKCMKFEPSKTRPTGTLFEDFAFVRGQIGLHTTGVASFFPWHRYLLWVFERELKNSCGYSGGIPFWNWALDSDALAQSPLLTEMPGFGGDGNPKSTVEGSHGAYCVTDGNFAGHKAAFDYIEGWGIGSSPHCVSRRFEAKDQDGHRAGQLVASSVISAIIDLPDYASFSDAMQNETTGLANAIPLWMQGDMAQFTAPNDVLYFLHLAQLDRIWWIWQHQVTSTRLDDYTGRRRNDLDDVASVHDTLSLGTLLAPDIEVYDAMWGQWNFMCFTYYL